jgi:hypothetical protein
MWVLTYKSIVQTITARVIRERAIIPATRQYLQVFANKLIIFLQAVF